MKLIDTVALIGFLNPSDAVHHQATEHLRRLRSRDDIFVPATSLIEADLVMKLRGYDEAERRSSWEALEGIIPSDQVIPNTPSSIGQAVDVQRGGMDYFDSLIIALAKETGSSVVTTDKKIQGAVEAEW